MEGEISKIIGKDWMEEWGIVKGVRKEVILDEGKIWMKYQDDSKEHIRLQLRRKRKQGW